MSNLCPLIDELEKGETVVGERVCLWRPEATAWSSKALY